MNIFSQWEYLFCLLVQSHQRNGPKWLHTHQTLTSQSGESKVNPAKGDAGMGPVHHSPELLEILKEAAVFHFPLNGKGLGTKIALCQSLTKADGERRHAVHGGPRGPEIQTGSPSSPPVIRDRQLWPRRCRSLGGLGRQCWSEEAVPARVPSHHQQEHPDKLSEEVR